MADDHRAIDREAFIAAVALMGVLILCIIVSALWSAEPVTRSGPFWRPDDWERRNGSLRGAEERERKERAR